MRAPKGLAGVATVARRHISQTLLRSVCYQSPLQAVNVHRLWTAKMSTTIVETNATNSTNGVHAIDNPSAGLKANTNAWIGAKARGAFDLRSEFPLLVRIHSINITDGP
jgi:hypothetical protein